MPDRRSVAPTGGVSSLSVIIPALNEEESLDSLLSDLAGQTREADEVIVVDAGSEDGTVSVAERPGVRVLAGYPPVAKGRNLGGKSARGGVLIFLDADVRLPKGFLEGFVAEFEDRRLDVACPLYEPYDSTLAIRALHAFFNLLFESFQRLLPSGAGHCIAIRGRSSGRARASTPS